MKKPSLINISDFSRESWPYFYYTKIGVIYETMYATFPIDPGYYYQVNRINARWANENILIRPGFASPLKVSFIKDSGKTALQVSPFDLQLMASPAESGVVVDFTNAARPMTARPLTRSKTVNVLYVFRDVLNITFSNITAVTIPGNPDGSLPAYIDFMIQGRLYPVLDQEGWGK